MVKHSIRKTCSKLHSFRHRQKKKPRWGQRGLFTRDRGSGDCGRSQRDNALLAFSFLGIETRELVCALSGKGAQIARAATLSHIGLAYPAILALADEVLE